MVVSLSWAAVPKLRARTAWGYGSTADIGHGLQFSMIYPPACWNHGSRVGVRGDLVSWPDTSGWKVDEAGRWLYFQGVGHIRSCPNRLLIC